MARSPIDGTVTAHAEDPRCRGRSTAAIGRAHAAFLTWRSVPAPRRGELVRLFGEELRANKDALAALVTIEAGKIVPEARGEVQEMIDICDFACGLSRQLYGLTIASERPGHRMSETWHPLGVVGVISAFNFPVAVWAWNFALAARLRRLGRVEAVREDAAHRARVSVALPSRVRALRAGAAPPRPRASPRSSSATRRSASSSSTIAASRSSARRARRAWAAPSRRASRRASVARCSSSAATTR